MQCAKNHKDILTNPSPDVLFNDFADSYLEFELRCWTSIYPDWVFIRSDIRVAIDDAFEKAGIVIPFPQRDLHIINDRSNIESKEADLPQRKKHIENTDDKERSDDMDE